MKRLFFIFSLLTLNFLGCATSTVYLHKDPAVDTVEFQQDYHCVVYGLVTISPAVKVQKLCHGKGWQTIKIEKSFIQN